MYQRKNWKLFTRVKIIQLPDNAPLLGETGTILGKSVFGPEDFYIVLLDKTVKDMENNNCLAVSFTEHCLEEINDERAKAIELVTQY